MLAVGLFCWTGGIVIQFEDFFLIFLFIPLFILPFKSLIIYLKRNGNHRLPPFAIRSSLECKGNGIWGCSVSWNKNTKKLIFIFRNMICSVFWLMVEWKNRKIHIISHFPFPHFRLIAVLWKVFHFPSYGKHKIVNSIKIFVIEICILDKRLSNFSEAQRKRK